MLRSKAFAEQLCILHSTPPIETEEASKRRDYVPKWLTTLVCNEDSQIVTSDEFPVIAKKIRDEVLGETEKSYFRRSYTYMGIKALLQHNLTVQCGPASGKLLYKILMFKFLIKICGFYMKSSCITFNIDLLFESIAKIARRILKMEQLIDDLAIDSNFRELHRTTVQATLREAKNVIGQIRVKIDDQIDNCNRSQATTIDWSEFRRKYRSENAEIDRIYAGA